MCISYTERGSEEVVSEAEVEARRLLNRMNLFRANTFIVARTVVRITRTHG